MFSEDGLTGFEFLNSEYFLPFTQFLPDDAIGWNACKNKGFHSIPKYRNKIGNVCVNCIIKDFMVWEVLWWSYWAVSQRKTRFILPSTWGGKHQLEGESGTTTTLTSSSTGFAKNSRKCCLFKLLLHKLMDSRNLLNQITEVPSLIESICVGGAR